jgi:hypothetical protein
MKASEMKLFLETVLPSYAQHLEEQPDTLINKFYGVYTFKLDNMDDIHCFITNNLIGKNFANVERIYDLKGAKQASRKTRLPPEQT